MPNDIEIYPIDPVYKPRQVIFECFKSIGRELPITGGWGGSKESAIVIDKNDPVVIPGLPFDGVGMEYLIVEKLIYLDLIITRPKDDRYSGINWKLGVQKLIHDGGRSYDCMNFFISAHTDKDFEMLKNEHEEGIRNGNLDFEEHLKKHNAFLKHYEKIFWFDITSFYGTMNFTGGTKAKGGGSTPLDDKIVYNLHRSNRREAR